MAVIQILSSGRSPSAEAKGTLLRDLSRALATHFGKSEAWVMTCLVPDVAMTFAGENSPACFAAVKKSGEMSSGSTATLSSDLCRRLSVRLGVPAERGFVEVTPAKGWLSGWSGQTVGLPA